MEDEGDLEEEGGRPPPREPITQHPPTKTAGRLTESEGMYSHSVVGSCILHTVLPLLFFCDRRRVRPVRQDEENLFEYAGRERMRENQPLAARMRPRTLDEFVGQDHILAPGRLLRRAIQADQLSSLIFYGPPGTGKTTLASVVAHTTQSRFTVLNAVMAGVQDVRQVASDAQRCRDEYAQRTILFVDEVHRWNKAQQDALLPYVENGTVVFIGATTENPYFTVNRPLVSRSRIFQLKVLSQDELRQVARAALEDSERGYGNWNVHINEDALDHLTDVANGDARAVLNALELGVETTTPDENERIVIDLAVAEESIQRRAVLYDKEGDYHFDTISAFIKSLRGSDPDAAVYWLAKMVYAGEDPRFIFRRMLIFTVTNAVRFCSSASRMSAWRIRRRLPSCSPQRKPLIASACRKAGIISVWPPFIWPPRRNPTLCLRSLMR